MMGIHGGWMMGVGFLGWLLNLLSIGIVVYFAVRLALREKNKHE